MTEDRSRSALLHRVAHELAGVANVVTGATEQLRFASGSSADQNSRTMAVLDRASARLVRAAHSLRTLALIEEGRLAVKSEGIVVEDLLRDAAQRAESAIARRGVSLEVVAASDGARVQGDSTLLDAAIADVIVNAIQHAKARVVVRSAMALSGDRAHIVVEDDGPGWPEGAAQWLQSPSGDRPARGLGLSLYLANEVVRLLGGALRLEPSSLPPGRGEALGAALVIELPLQSKK